MKCVAFILVAMVAVATSSTCNNVVFAHPEQWDVDPALASLWNLSLPTAPTRMNTTGVCSYFNGQDVCCNQAVLDAIHEASNRSQSALAEAQRVINNEDMFGSLVELLNTLAPNATVSADISALQQNIASLRDAQFECVRGLTAYAEGMMCMACLSNASAYVDPVTHSFLLSQETCSGVVGHCQPVVEAARGVLDRMLRIVMSLFPVDDAEFDTLPDMCGGTELRPGNCSEFICNVWLNGVRIPQYSWSLGPMNSSTRSNNALSAYEQVHKMLSRQISTLTTVAATTTTNTYVASGYPALTVGCADVDCNPTPQQPTSSNSLAIGLGVGGGVVVLAIVVALVVRHRAATSANSDEMMGLVGKPYQTL